MIIAYLLISVKKAIILLILDWVIVVNHVRASRGLCRAPNTAEVRVGEFCAARLVSGRQAFVATVPLYDQHRTTLAHGEIACFEQGLRVRGTRPSTSNAKVSVSTWPDEMIFLPPPFIN